MVNEIIEYYDKHISYKAMLSKVNGYWKVRLIANFFLLLTALSFGSYFFTKNIFSLIGSCVLILFTVVLKQVLDSKVIKKEYPKLYVSTFSWSKHTFDNQVKTQLIEKLDELGVRDKEKVMQVSELIKQRAMEERKPFIIITTFFGASIVPLWYVFIDKCFTILGNNPSDIFLLFTILTIPIISIASLIPGLIDFRDTILTKYQGLNKIYGYLKEIEIGL